MGRKWKDEIKINSIVELLGGNIRPAVPRRRDADCLPIDFHVQSHTDIILHGFHVPDLGVIQDEDVQRVPFDSLLDETGVIDAKRARKYEKPAQAEPEDDAESAISISDESVMSPCSISESDTD
ncbi:hypothetical protein HCN44_007715 [Aphidius gifuensis]|uniref:Uncharacterized protein n=1 Tax=Aphidius gifuensis TaxID=684658 RepID=A0A834XPP1_APHGI|nr:hypothetical protein HCN44_007715 [Aphidius gifuensis]